MHQASPERPQAGLSESSKPAAGHDRVSAGAASATAAPRHVSRRPAAWPAVCSWTPVHWGACDGARMRSYAFWHLCKKSSTQTLPSHSASCTRRAAVCCIGCCPRCGRVGRVRLAACALAANLTHLSAREALARRVQARRGRASSLYSQQNMLPPSWPSVTHKHYWLQSITCNQRVQSMQTLLCIDTTARISPSAGKTRHASFTDALQSYSECGSKIAVTYRHTLTAHAHVFAGDTQTHNEATT